jgi:hypothetical protein
MGDSVKAILGGDIRLPVEPVGFLAANGWLPGTFVKYMATPVSFSGALATVDISDGTGVIAGFLVTGPQHKQPVEKLSDMWTTDTRQRDGGSVAADWTAFDAGAAFYFDNFEQLQRMGSRIVSMCGSPAEGIFKFYVFETVDKAERTTPGTGATLVYTPGSKLYVSNRGRITSEKETLTSVWTGYILVNTGSDIEGNYILFMQGQSL